MPKHFQFLAIWVAVCAFGWLFGPLPGLAVLAYSLADVIRLLPIYFLQGLLIGVVVGAGQALVIRMVGGKPLRWFGATLIGYALTFPAGLLIDAAIPWRSCLAGNADLLASGSRWCFTPFPAALFLGLFVIGAAQWLALRPMLARQDRLTAALWVFGLWASHMLSFLLGHWFSTISLQVRPTEAFELIGYRVLTGAAIGALTGLLILILLSEKRQPLKRRSL
jgi:hypothetical protein